MTRHASCDGAACGDARAGRRVLGHAVWQMNGMDMGTATQLGSFGFFIAVWVAMMAAMMLPGAAPAVAQARPR